MRTNIDIDDALLHAAMTATGLATKKATIEQALRSLVDRHRRKNAIANLSGIGWEGDLEEMRRDRPEGTSDRRR
ncbi:type II toxin-antitoxin system VapB family antitoxin [Rhizobium etli]|uniref:type II toxin-antitoxin system VapB family antitoxin n=1 Tax=Rhizobium etli TaxID=29449 RepID=UPI0005A83C29|nr:type II toxin-antitoxin system VapB family antitoxin [Rhizobium etli]